MGLIKYNYILAVSMLCVVAKTFAHEKTAIPEQIFLEPSDLKQARIEEWKPRPNEQGQKAFIEKHYNQIVRSMTKEERLDYKNFSTNKEKYDFIRWKLISLAMQPVTAPKESLQVQFEFISPFLELGDRLRWPNLNQEEKPAFLLEKYQNKNLKPILDIIATDNVKELSSKLRKNEFSADEKNKMLLSAAKANSSNAKGEAVNVIALLVTKPDVDINIKDDLERTPLMYAAMSGAENVVRTLLARPGINVDAQDYLGNTALTYALFSNNPTISTLISKVADRNKPNIAGLTPLRWAELLANYLVQAEEEQQEKLSVK